MIEAAEKCPDARRVAPIRACVFYQIDRLKSGFEAVERTVIPGICALMGATRLASVFSAASSRVGFFSSLMIIPNGPHTVFVILPFCLHSALFVCTALIIKQIGRVDTICTQLHSSALCLHDVCTSVSTVSARDLHAEVCYGRQARRSEQQILLPPIVVWSPPHNQHMAEWVGCRQVQTEGGVIVAACR